MLVHCDGVGYPLLHLWLPYGEVRTPVLDQEMKSVMLWTDTQFNAGSKEHLVLLVSRGRTFLHRVLCSEKRSGHMRLAGYDVTVRHLPQKIS